MKQWSRNAAVRRVSLATDAAPGGQVGLDHVLQWGLVALLAWAPLPFGSARPWAWSLLGVLAASLLLVAGLRALRRSGATPPLGQLQWPLLLGGLLIAWGLVQWMPGGLFGWHHPLWDKAAEVLAPPLMPSISVDREASLVYLFRLLIYAAVFLIAWQAGQSAEGAALVLRALAAIGAVYALYGLVEYASPSPRILWFRKWSYVDDLTSTFVNRNSFATFAGLTVIAGLVPLAQLLVRGTDARSRTSLVLSVIENLLSRGKWPLAGTTLAGSALLLSHSRGGSMATLCGLVAFVLLAMTAPSLRSSWRVPFAWIAGFVGLGALLLAGSGVLQRVMEDPIEADSRRQIYVATLAAIHDNVLAGTGLGSFQFIFPQYQPPELDYVIDIGHNDYLQNMLELGLPASLLLFATIGLLVVECAQGVRRRRKDALYPCAAVAASMLVAAHSLVDFSLQIPAVTLVYAAILGVGVAQSVSSRGAPP